MTLVSLSKVLYYNSFSSPRGKWVEVDIVYEKGTSALGSSGLYRDLRNIKKGCYWPYDQGTNVKRIDTVIVKCAIYKFVIIIFWQSSHSHTDMAESANALEWSHTHAILVHGSSPNTRNQNIGIGSFQNAQRTCMAPILSSILGAKFYTKHLTPKMPETVDLHCVEVRCKGGQYLRTKLLLL